MNRTVTILALTMVLVSAAIPLSAAAGSAQQDSYAGSHVTFETTESAVVDYRVDGEQTVDSVRVQSQSNADASLGVGASADVLTSTDIVGAALSLDAQSETSAQVTTESGATIEGHDNGHGSLIVTADEQSQYVAVNLSEGAEAEQESEQRVVFTNDNGTETTAMVAGDGNVSVTEDGDLTASLDQDSRLVVRTYGEERTSDDETEEELIVNGTAAASVYVGEEGGERTTDTVAYTEDTTVEVSQQTESRVNMTVSRSQEDGRVVITHLSNETAQSTDDLTVRVDGEAAVRASSYSGVRQATDGGDRSKYMVQSSSEASAQTRVILGINHFSTRSVSMGAGDSTDSSAGAGDEETTTGSGPGFGIAVTLLALLAAAGIARRR